MNDLIIRARLWCQSWKVAWGDDGEPVDDDWDQVYALEDEAREIVEALAELERT